MVSPGLINRIVLFFLATLVPVALHADAGSSIRGEMIATFESRASAPVSLKIQERIIRRTVARSFNSSAGAKGHSITSVRPLLREFCTLARRNGVDANTLHLKLMADSIERNGTLSQKRVAALKSYVAGAPSSAEICNTYVIRNRDLDSAGIRGRFSSRDFAGQFRISAVQPVFTHSVLVSDLDSLIASNRRPEKSIAVILSPEISSRFSELFRKNDFELAANSRHDGREGLVDNFSSISPLSMRQQSTLISRSANAAEQGGFIALVLAKEKGRAISYSTKEAARGLLYALVKGADSVFIPYSADPILETLMHRLKSAGISAGQSLSAKPVPTRTGPSTQPPAPQITSSSETQLVSFSGFVKQGSMPIYDVEIYALFPGPYAVAVKTDMQGNYQFQAPANQPGEIQPVKQGCTFLPSTLNVTGKEGTNYLDTFQAICPTPTPTRTPTPTPTPDRSKTPIGTSTPTPTATQTPGGSGTIVFKAVESLTKAGVAGVMVQVAAPNGTYAVTAFTDMTGTYRFLKVPAGTVYMTDFMCDTPNQRVLQLAVNQELTVVSEESCAAAPTPTQIAPPTATPTRTSVPVTPTPRPTATPLPTETPEIVTYVSLSGRYLYSGSTTGVPEVQLSVRNVTSGSLRTAKSDAQGNYYLPGLLSGEVYELQSTKSSCTVTPALKEIALFYNSVQNFYVTCSVSPTPTPIATSTPKVTLTPAPSPTPTIPYSKVGTILAITFDSRGIPLAGVTINAINPTNGKSMGSFVTQAGGIAYIPLPPGMLVQLYATQGGLMFAPPQTVTAPTAGGMIQARFYYTLVIAM